jgi:hypothetical protein
LSEKKNGLRAILVLTGAAGSGKTTVATLLGESLSTGSLLYIDATPDQALGISLAPDKPGMSLAQLFTKSEVRSTSSESSSEGLSPSILSEANASSSIQKHDDSGETLSAEAKPASEFRSNLPAGREAIDWTFSDLTVPVGEESDLLVVGDLPATLDVRDHEKLTYGLRRLINGYKAVIIDGEHPLLLSLLPKEVVHMLSVVTPAQFLQWQLSQLQGEYTPALVLNAYTGEPLPEALEAALQGEQLRLIAKIPRYANDSEREQKMSQHFESALLRLNIPMFPV